MKTFTIRTADKEIEKVLKKESVLQGKSINSLVLEAISKTFLPKKDVRFDDLDALFGSWSDKEFKDFGIAVQDLQRVDKRDWL